MTRPYRALLLFAAAVLAVTPDAEAQEVGAGPDNTALFPAASPQSLGLDPDRLINLVQLSRDWVEDGRIIGAEILIIKDGRTALHETVGWSDKEADLPLSPGSIYRLRSATKPFTGTAALMLVDRGLLELDDLVADLLPSWRNRRSGAITVQQLLTHFSGFEQNGTPEPASTYPDLRAVVDASGAQGPQHSPGARFIYSDVNTMTLGALVTEITGIPLDEFIRSEIIEPLGLTDVFVGFSTDEAWADRTNPTYARDEDGRWEKYWTPDEEPLFGWFRASGGMFSTTRGYAQWLAAWLDGTSGLARDGPSGLLRYPLAVTATRLHGSDEVAGYGYHWEVWREEPLVFGHSGSDGTIALAVPSQQLILLYFTQSRRSGTIAEWIDAALTATLPTRPALPIR